MGCGGSSVVRSGVGPGKKTESLSTQWSIGLQIHVPRTRSLNLSVDLFNPPPSPVATGQCPYSLPTPSSTANLDDVRVWT